MSTSYTDRGAGVLSVSLGGRAVTIRGKLEIQMQAYSREAIATLTGAPTFKVSPIVPSIAVDVQVTRGITLAGLVAIQNATITATLRSGAVYVLEGAWCEGEVKLDAAEGSTSVEFRGVDMREIAAK